MAFLRYIQRYNELSLVSKVVAIILQNKHNKVKLINVSFICARLEVTLLRQKCLTKHWWRQVWLLAIWEILKCTVHNQMWGTMLVYSYQNVHRACKVCIYENNGWFIIWALKQSVII